MNYTKKRLYAPIRIGIIFSLFTYYLFVFGVWDFPFRDSLNLFIFVLLCNLFMYLGFIVGTKKNVKYNPKINNILTKRLFHKLFNFIFITTAITFIPRFIIDTGFYTFDFSTLLLKIQLGLKDSATVYSMNKTTPSATGIWIYINYICVATGFISWIYTGLAVVTWHKMNFIARFFSIIYWIVLVIQNLAQGTNFGIFDLGIQMLYFYLIKKSIISVTNNKIKDFNNSDKTSIRKKAKLKKRYIIIIISILLVLINYFKSVMSSRVGEYYFRLVPYGNDFVRIRTNSLLWRVCPEQYQSLIATLNSYVSHGYMGLAMAFGISFTSTFGFGDSWFKLLNFFEYTGIDLFPRTYLMKIYEAYGYHYGGYWHTVYLWFANDVSLFGVPIVLFILMYIFGFAWKDFLINNNALALMLMSTFAVFFTFISANNQVFSSPNMLFAFWIILIVWLFNRRKYDWSDIFLK